MLAPVDRGSQNGSGLLQFFLIAAQYCDSGDSLLQSSRYSLADAARTAEYKGIHIFKGMI